VGERGVDARPRLSGAPRVAAGYEQPAVDGLDPLGRLHPQPVRPADRPPHVLDHRLGTVVGAADPEREAVGDGALEILAQQ
jgi:hypothetical protein